MMEELIEFSALIVNACLGFFLHILAFVWTGRGPIVQNSISLPITIWLVNFLSTVEANIGQNCMSISHICYFDNILNFHYYNSNSVKLIEL